MFSEFQGGFRGIPETPVSRTAVSLIVVHFFQFCGLILTWKKRERIRANINERICAYLSTLLFDQGDSQVNCEYALNSIRRQPGIL